MIPTPTESPDTIRFLSQEEVMSRKVGVQKGSLVRRGPSWLVKFREYAKDEHNQPVVIPRCERVGPRVGPGALTKQDAQREANRLYLDDINRRNLKPSSSMLVKDFVETKFELQVISKKKAAGKKHYGYILDAFVIPFLGKRRLCDVDVDAIETLVASVRDQGYSWQTAMHCQTCCSRIFRLAKKLKLYQDENPAAGVDAGDKPIQRKRPGYSWQQAALVLNRLRNPAKLMAKLSVATSMNVAEMCGIRLRWCNFTDQIAVFDGEVLGPFSIGVRENYYEGEYGTLKAGKRLRNVPLTRELAHELAAYVQSRESHREPDAPLFSSRNGTPVDQHNIANRIFRPLQTKLGFPVTWHGFRRAHSTFAGQLESLPMEDRIATMGHADAKMSLYYSIADVERRRRIPSEILTRLDAEPVKPELEEMEPEGGVA
jgi:integrase